LTYATVNFQVTSNTHIPFLANDPPGRCDSSLPGPYEIPGAVSFHIALLPFLDNSAAIETIEIQETAEKANLALQVVLNQRHDFFICIANGERPETPGLSDYVANCGYGEFAFSGRRILQLGKAPHAADKFDAWDRDPLNGVSPLDKKIARATGLFWVPDADGWRRSLDQVVTGDGASQTLMYSEKVNAGPLSRAGTTAARCGFVIGRSSLNFSGRATNYLEISSVSRPFQFGINRHVGTSAQPAPIPSSNHSKGSLGRGVNVSYCDAHVGFLSENIDPIVYAQLLSPNGTQFGQTKLKPSDY
jgi:prepilin-type processing-associated H-X9-DG protein